MTMEMVITITRIGLETGFPIGVIMMIICTRTMMMRTAGMVDGLGIILLKEVLAMMSSRVLGVDLRGTGPKGCLLGVKALEPQDPVLLGHSLQTQEVP